MEAHMLSCRSEGPNPKKNGGVAEAQMGEAARLLQEINQEANNLQ